MPGISVRQGDMLAMVLDGTSQAQWASASGVYTGGFLSRRSYGSLDWDRMLAAGVNSTVVAGENLTVGSTVWLPAESLAPGR